MIREGKLTGYSFPVIRLVALFAAVVVVIAVGGGVVGVVVGIIIFLEFLARLLFVSSAEMRRDVIVRTLGPVLIAGEILLGKQEGIVEGHIADIQIVLLGDVLMLGSLMI